jgi:hypothetical protein
MPRAPVLREIVRQHAEMTAHLWNVYDYHLLNPDLNPDMDEVRLARLVERLEAHLDGLRVAGDVGREIAAERYAEYREAGELFVLRMVQPGSEASSIVSLDLDRVRAFIKAELEKTAERDGPGVS